MNKLEKLNRPLIIAHRGASAYAPENTLAAFRLAVEQGADAIELDVKLSKDDQVIVIHDQTLSRTTGVKGNIKKFTKTEIEKLDAGSLFSADYRGEKIPTLDHVFGTVGGKILVNVELTNYSTPDDLLVEKVVEVVRTYNMNEYVFFSSFNPQNLAKIKKLLPECPVAILALPGITGFLNRSWIGKRVAPQIIHPHYLSTSSAFIQKEHRGGRRVHAWTVNDRSVMQRLFLSGIDGIFTDDPILAREVLSQS